MDDGDDFFLFGANTELQLSVFSPEWDLCVPSPGREQRGLYWRQMLCPNIGTVLPVRKKAFLRFVVALAYFFEVFEVFLAWNVLLLKDYMVLLQIPTGLTQKSMMFNIKDRQVFSVLRRFEATKKHFFYMFFWRWLSLMSCVCVLSRFCALVKRRRDGVCDSAASLVVPPVVDNAMPTHHCVPDDVDPELVFFCRHVYDFRYGRLLKNLQ